MGLVLVGQDATIADFEQALLDAPYNQAAPAPRLTAWADWREVLAPYR